MELELSRDERLTQAERCQAQRTCTCIRGELCVCFYVPTVDEDGEPVAEFGGVGSSPSGSSLSLRTSM